MLLDEEAKLFLRQSAQQQLEESAEHKLMAARLQNVHLSLDLEETKDSESRELSEIPVITLQTENSDSN